jgi:DNA-binding transcriptional LysR family regulator
MIIDNLNLNHLKIFECVYRNRSMTSASKELRLTQSGVSQHIKSLEQVLGIKLFDRIKQKLIPTAEATTLFKECAQGLHQIENVLLMLKSNEEQLCGTVGIGMPSEFGKNVIMPLLVEFTKKNPHIKLKLKLGFASEMNDDLLMGEIDFAFVDEFNLDQKIKIENVYDEVLGLYIQKALLKEYGPIKNKREFYEKLNYVEYDVEKFILKKWCYNVLGLRNVKANVRATVMNVQALASLILHGMGAGILPDHYMVQLGGNARKLHRFEGRGKALTNKISLAYLHERTHSPAALAIMDFLRQRLKKAN